MRYLLPVIFAVGFLLAAGDISGFIFAPILAFVVYDEMKDGWWW